MTRVHKYLRDCVTADMVREWGNCREADIDDAGDVWIADPQRGHWLGRDEIARLVRWCRSS